MVATADTCPMQGSWCGPALRLLSANSAFVLLEENVVIPEEQLKQAKKRAKTENLWQCLTSILKLGTIVCSHQKSFSCTMRINKHFYKTYPFAVSTFKHREMLCEHEHTVCAADRCPRGPAEPSC